MWSKCYVPRNVCIRFICLGLYMHHDWRCSCVVCYIYVMTLNVGMKIYFVYIISQPKSAKILSIELVIQPNLIEFNLIISPNWISIKILTSISNWIEPKIKIWITLKFNFNSTKFNLVSICHIELNSNSFKHIELN